MSEDFQDWPKIMNLHNIICKGLGILYNNLMLLLQIFQIIDLALDKMVCLYGDGLLSFQTQQKRFKQRQRQGQKEKQVQRQKKTWLQQGKTQVRVQQTIYADPQAVLVYQIFSGQFLSFVGQENAEDPDRLVVRSQEETDVDLGEHQAIRVNA